MAGNSEHDPIRLKELILNARQPVLLRNFPTKWKCCTTTLEDWCNNFDESKTVVEFEQMPVKSDSSRPQWEGERKKIKMTMKEFLNKVENKDHWFAFNYQTPNEIPDKCKEGVDFSCFGFPHLTNDYARFWLSTSNANTPCHQDTYGCNIVVQAFGSKLWLLFPPHAPLNATRLPYEESSIYCKENFYAPDPTQIYDVKRLETYAHICTLEAGDVLIVPRFWWHFVETKSVALSINAWIPLNIDKHAQLKECLVKYIIETIAVKERAEVFEHMLNPNQKEIGAEADTLSILAFLTAKINSEDKTEEVRELAERAYDYQYLDEAQFEILLSEFPNAFLVEKSSRADFNSLITKNSLRYEKNDSESPSNPISFIKETLINSLCAENVLQEIVQEFTKRLNL